MPHTTELLLSLAASNIARFERLLAEARDDETRVTLVELLAEEREGIKRLASAPQPVEGISSPPGVL